MSDDYQGGPYPLQPQTNGLAIASLVIGIIALVLSWIPLIGFISWILAPAGLIMGFIALGKPVSKGMAVGGLITSALALLICILWVVGLGAAMSVSSMTY
ncbi:MAG: hypothetical protein ACXW3K_02120 [Brevundimonas sp.]